MKEKNLFDPCFEKTRDEIVNEIVDDIDRALLNVLHKLDTQSREQNLTDSDSAVRSLALAAEEKDGPQSIQHTGL